MKIRLRFLHHTPLTSCNYGSPKNKYFESDGAQQSGRQGFHYALSLDEAILPSDNPAASDSKKSTNDKSEAEIGSMKALFLYSALSTCYLM
ncbi:hypothetical protein TcasGA2_TC013286 [Tribolium castaneum]|uniref:Uncharacterized protein n=1 Tax=Tribolium castaneum TaxID=7070 RepID=D6WP35_TRICA|nr:hypothetical protein TcasGA2_TC013286 [Tribolium castaneum]